jgi:hypothetical protein
MSAITQATNADCVRGARLYSPYYRQSVTVTSTRRDQWGRMLVEAELDDGTDHPVTFKPPQLEVISWEE